LYAKISGILAGFMVSVVQLHRQCFVRDGSHLPGAEVLLDPSEFYDGGF